MDDFDNFIKKVNASYETGINNERFKSAIDEIIKEDSKIETKAEKEPEKRFEKNFELEL